MSGPDRAVRSAHAGDAEAVARIFVAAAQVGWAHLLPAEGLATIEGPKRWRDVGPGGAVVAEVGDRVVGFAIFRPSADRDSDPAVTGEVDGLHVDPSAWGKGVGRRLLDEAVESLRAEGFREATLWTAKENTRACRLYERAGWKPNGTIRREQFHGEAFDSVRYLISLDETR
jgi:ribosomal protein S18 acetylase RimI-like enzyme